MAKFPFAFQTLARDPARNDHSILSPSSADRWVQCPASTSFIQRLADVGAILGDTTGVAAQKGTAAHALFEQALLNQTSAQDALSAISADHQDLIDDDLILAVQESLDALEQLLQDAGPKSLAFAEMPVDPAPFTQCPETYGTADVVVYDNGNNTLWVIDLKTGRHPVSPASYQLVLYSLGAVAELENKILGAALPDSTIIKQVILQPRAFDTKPVARVHEMGMDRLFDINHLTRNQVRIAYNPDSYRDYNNFNPSNAACKWCPAAPLCGPYKKFSEDEILTAIMKSDSSGKDYHLELDPDWARQVILAAPKIKEYIATIERQIKEQMLAGEAWPGLKLKPKSVRAKINPKTTPEELARLLRVSVDDVAEVKPKTLTYLRKLAKKQNATDALESVLIRPEPDYAVVADEDFEPELNEDEQIDALLNNR